MARELLVDLLVAPLGLGERRYRFSWFGLFEVGLEGLMRRVLALRPTLRHPLAPDALRRARVGHIDQFQGVRILGSEIADLL